MENKIKSFVVKKKFTEIDLIDSRYINLVDKVILVDFLNDNRREICKIIKIESEEYTFEICKIVFEDRHGAQYELEPNTLGQKYDLYYISDRDIDKSRSPYILTAIYDVIDPEAVIEPLCNEHGFPKYQKHINVVEQATTIYEWSNVDIERYENILDVSKDFEEDKPVVVYRHGRYYIAFMECIIDDNHMMFRGSGERFDIHQKDFDNGNKSVFKILNKNNITINKRSTDAYIETSCESLVITSIEQLIDYNIRPGDKISIDNSITRRRFIIDEEPCYSANKKAAILILNDIDKNENQYIKIHDYISDPKCTVTIYKKTNTKG